MKLDLDWPVPPRHGIPLDRQPPSELKPTRAFAVGVLNKLATIAETHALERDADGELQLLPEDRPYRTPEAFVGVCLASLLEQVKGDANVDLVLPDFTVPASTGTWKGWAAHPSMENKALLIERGHFHLLGPIRGDIVIFSDGHVAIVTVPQCSGCRHFEAAEFTPRSGAAQVPSVFTSKHWLTTVNAIVRLVFAPAAKDAAAPTTPKRKKGDAS